MKSILETPRLFVNWSLVVALAISVGITQSSNSMEPVNAGDRHASRADRAKVIVPQSTNRNGFLVVLRDEAIASAVVPSKSADIVRTANSTSVAASGLLSALLFPKMVRHLIVERPSDEYIAALKVGSVEYRLLNYVVLQYTDDADLVEARELLTGGRVRLFRAVEYDSVVAFSATPNDPYFAPTDQTSPLNKQWGMSALNLPAAWDTQKGYAYIGVVDNGIQRNHPDLTEDRLGNVRAHFSGSWIIYSPVRSDADFDENFNPYFLGHGSHVAGIIAATTNNPSPTGVAGVCWNCSLAIAKATNSGGLSEANLAMSVYGMVSRGVQAINISSGKAGVSCGAGALSAYCDAIQFAADRDIVIVAAAGNNNTDLQFPASDSRTFSVGGYQSNAQPWNQLLALGSDSPARANDADGEIGTNFGSNQLVVAPARDVLSTMYANSQWNNRCGSVSNFNTNPPYLQFIGAVTQTIFASGSANLYGICTGTSMAAPHITGLVGLIRSTSPLLTIAQVRSNIQQAAGGVFIDGTWGYGLPNANTAVLNAIPSQRLTPLFAFYNSSMDDYAYTVFPQMGAALNEGSVPPFVGTASSTGGYYTYSWIGNTVAQFPSTFAGVTIAIKPGQISAENYRPRAVLRVFTTPHDASGVPLWPLCRFSYVVGTQVRHLMDTSTSCAVSPMPTAAILDGSEGYVYPPNQPQPSGTTAVVRMEKVPGGGIATVFVVTAQSDQAYYAGIGFFNPVLLGYAFLN